MIRALVALVVVAAAAIAAAWFARDPGLVAVDWRGWRLETSTGAAVVALVVAAVVLAVLARVWSWFRRGPRRMGATRDIERRRQGYRALSRGMVAVAAGDAEESGRWARRAEQLLEEPPLTLLLSAQAAQLNGDDGAAERYFDAMLANPELEFLGLRGLLTLELRRGDADAALEHARRAYRLRPGTEWIQGTLFELQIGAHQWKQAVALLHDMGRRGAVPEQTTRRRRAILLLDQADTAGRDGDSAAAVRHALRAHSAAPDFVPAAAVAARLLAATGRSRRGTRVIEETWRFAPHPDLAAALGALWPEDGADKRRERLQRLDALAPGHPEGRIARARAALDGGDWAAARSHLGAVTGDAPEARVCRLWAELEDAEHGPGLAAREWLLRAAHARPDAAWVCANCGRASARWSSGCPHCSAFDALEWGPAGEGEPQSIDGAAAPAPALSRPAEAAPGPPPPGATGPEPPPDEEPDPPASLLPMPPRRPDPDRGRRQEVRLVPLYGHRAENRKGVFPGHRCCPIISLARLFVVGERTAAPPLQK